MPSAHDTKHRPDATTWNRMRRSAPGCIIAAKNGPPWSPRAQRSVYSARRKMAPSRRRRSNASLSGSTGARVRSFIAARTLGFRSAFLVSRSFSSAPPGGMLLMNYERPREERTRGGRSERIDDGGLFQAVWRERGRELRTVLRPGDRNALRHDAA